MKTLKCPDCGTILKLLIRHTGEDYDTEAGEGSGFGWEVSLVCSRKQCGSLFVIGNVKERSHFSVLNDHFKCIELDEESL